MQFRALALSLALALLFRGAGATRGGVAGARNSSSDIVAAPEAERTLALDVNEERIRRNLQPLEVDAQLTDAARRHARRMAERGELTHQFADETGLAVRIAASGLTFGESGENVGRAVDADDVHAAQMHSPPHRANVLNARWNVIGVGAYQRDKTLWVCIDFARRVHQYTAQQAEDVVAASIGRWFASHGSPAPERYHDDALEAGACTMSKNDKMDLREVSIRPVGPAKLLGYTTEDLTQLPSQAIAALQGRPKSAGIGVCFARTASLVGGGYWVVLEIR